MNNSVDNPILNAHGGSLSMDDIKLDDPPPSKESFCSICCLFCTSNRFYHSKKSSNPLSFIQKLLFFLLTLTSLILVYRWFYTKLGSGIFQRHTLVSRNTLTYKLSEIHNVLPIHEFMYFDTKEVKDHVRCA